jgi:rare lipoprotein A
MVVKKAIQITTILLFTCITSALAQQSGKATFYNNKFQGRHSADGGRYQKDSLTCAHRTLPFGTLLKVRNLKNNQEVIVKVTDRGPHRKKVMIDLSYGAAKKLDAIRQGVANVEITKIDSLQVLKPYISTAYSPR